MVLQGVSLAGLWEKSEFTVIAMTRRRGVIAMRFVLALLRLHVGAYR